MGKRIVCLCLILLCKLSFTADIIRAGKVTATPGDDVTVDIYATHDEDALIGFSWAIRYNSDLIEMVDYSIDGTDTNILEPEFFYADIRHEDDYGSMSVIFEIGQSLGIKFLGPATEQLIAKAIFNVPEGTPVGQTVIVDFEHHFGTPPIDLVFLYKAPPPILTEQVFPIAIDGEIAIRGIVPPKDFTSTYSQQDGRVMLSWTNPQTFEKLEIERNGEIIATIENLEAGTDSTYVVSDFIAGLNKFRLISHSGQEQGATEFYSVFVGSIEDVLVIPNQGEDRVKFFDLTGNLASEIELAENAAPYGVAVNFDGTAWITAPGTNEVYWLSSVGTNLIEDNGAVSTGVEPWGIAVTPEGDVLVICKGVGGAGTLMRLRSDGKILWGGDGIGDSPEDGLQKSVDLPSGPTLIACGPIGNAWVVCEDAEKIVRVAPEGGKLVIDLPASSKPRAIAVDRQGQAWVTIQNPPQLLRISFDGHSIDSFSVPADPFGIAIDGQNRIFLTHPTSDTVTVWDFAGNSIETISLAAFGGENPHGIGIDGEGSIWIACTDTGNIAKISKALDVTTTYNAGSSPHALGDPTGFLVANILQGKDDQDGDSNLNREEIDVGSNPFNSDSKPIDIIPDYVTSVKNLAWELEDSTVTLTWENPFTYDEIEILRNDEPLTPRLSGDTTSFIEKDLSTGAYRYKVIGIFGAGESEPVSCLATVGARADAEVPSPARNVADITLVPGGFGELFLMDAYSGKIFQVFNKAEKQSIKGDEKEITSPFGSQGRGSGIAYNFKDKSLYVTGTLPGYESEVLIELSITGKQISSPSALSDETHQIQNVTSLCYEPEKGFFIIINESDPEDDWIATFRKTGNEITFIDDLCITGTAVKEKTELDKITGVSVSSFHETTEDELYLFLFGQESDKNKVIEVKISSGTIEFINDVEVYESSGVYRGSFDAVCEFIVTDRSLDRTLDRLYRLGVFLRGDANDDGTVNLGDAISVLSYLFADGELEGKKDAADSNDDGEINLADAITILSYLFSDYGPLLAPFPGPCFDPTDDNLED